MNRLEINKKVNNTETKKENKKEIKREKSNHETNKFAKWFKECKSEIKKVVWPDKKQVVNNTLAVIFMVLISVALISILDVSFYWPIKLLLEKF